MIQRFMVAMILAACVGLAALATFALSEESPKPMTIDDISTTSPQGDKMGQDYNIIPEERRSPPSRLEFDALSERVKKLEGEVVLLKQKAQASEAPANEAPENEEKP